MVTWSSVIAMIIVIYITYGICNNVNNIEMEVLNDGTIRNNKMYGKIIDVFNHINFIPPGTFLLTILIKNEAEHLDRTLPKWAKFIDSWIIGVDDENTDNSPEIIKKHLGHIPGEIMIVHFDGMGPTWSELVTRGIDKYSHITHGIIADADFMPVEGTFDKNELDINASKHFFTVISPDGETRRSMNWIYRNIQGVQILRRTHQIVKVPDINGRNYQPPLKFVVTEKGGGYQDRSGKKYHNYIKWLLKDLIDYPNDSRTMYYIAYAHYELYMIGKDDPDDENWFHLSEALKYFKERLPLDGHQEEKWFTHIKIAEIYEILGDWTNALEHYEICIKDDPDRIDSYFHVGEYYRRNRKFDLALPYLKTASNLAVPNRLYFQWYYCYECLAEIELGKAVFNLEEDLSQDGYKEILAILRNGTCKGEDDRVLQSLIISIEEKIEDVEDPKITTIKQFIDIFKNSKDLLILELGKLEFDHLIIIVNKMEEFLKKDTSSCRLYRLSTTPYLKHVENSPISAKISNIELKSNIESVTKKFRVLCR